MGDFGLIREPWPVKSSFKSGRRMTYKTVGLFIDWEKKIFV